MNTTDKLAVANRVLETFSSVSRIERRRGGFYVCWRQTWKEGQPEICRRWRTIGGNDFYPVWYRKWPGGGTATTALSQLIRWLQGRPVLPISTWRYWATEQISLLPAKAVDTLLAACYPERVNCVLCGKPVAGVAGKDPTLFDWWNLDGISGPCCYWNMGCRQENRATINLEDYLS